jgi:hypothetical protein
MLHAALAALELAIVMTPKEEPKEDKEEPKEETV